MKALKTEDTVFTPPFITAVTPTRHKPLAGPTHGSHGLNSRLRRIL